MSAAAAMRFQHTAAADEGAKALTKAVTTGAYWTNERLARAGCPVSRRCPLCGADKDSLHHRLWWCPKTEDLRQTPERKKLTERARLEGEKHIVYELGLVPNTATAWPRPRAESPWVSVHRKGWLGTDEGGGI